MVMHGAAAGNRHSAISGRTPALRPRRVKYQAGIANEDSHRFKFLWLEPDLVAAN